MLRFLVWLSAVVVLVAPTAIMFSATPSWAVATFDPVFTCHYSAANRRVSGAFEGGWPTTENLRLRGSGFQNLPIEIYEATTGPMTCAIVYDMDNIMPNGSYTKTLCAPLGQGTVPNTPSCFNPKWKPQ